MPADPRLALAARSVQDPTQRMSQRLADLERRVGSLESSPTIQAGSVLPTGPLREGTPFVQTGTRRFYVYVDGALRYVALT